MVKIVDVARHAGVSTATVSRVLNKNARVAEDLRGRVERAVTELGYNLNVAARSLRTRRSSKLLVMVPDISNTFFAEVIRGAEEAAREAGFSVMIGDTGGDEALECQYAALLHRREVDGLVILGHRIPGPVSEMLGAGRGAISPVVHGCEYSPDLGVPSVHIDNLAAGAMAIEHLLDLGHRTIGVITGPLDSPLSRDRLDGARRAAATISETVLAVRHASFSMAAGHAHAADLVAAGATALFCFSDEMAVGALRALADCGLACPGDVSVVGFDDIGLASFTAPRLTTIAQPRREIGRRTVHLLLRQLNEGSSDAGSVVLPHRLVVRQSTGPARS